MKHESTVERRGKAMLLALVAIFLVLAVVVVLTWRKAPTQPNVEEGRAVAERFLDLVRAGKAPEAWAGLPDPDAIYVGGSGRHVTMLVEEAWKRLKPGGRLATACNSIENLASVHALLRSRSSDAAYWMVNIARGIEQLDRIRFEAINPSFLIAATKPV